MLDAPPRALGLPGRVPRLLTTPLLTCAFALAVAIPATGQSPPKGGDANGPPKGGDANGPPKGGDTNGPPASAPAQDPRSAGTKEMAELLERIAGEADPFEAYNLTEERVAMWRKRLEHAIGKPREARLRLSLAKDLLQSNRCEEAIAMLDALDAVLAVADPVDDSIARESRELRALAWLRLGELENCVEHRCCSSCIAPIAGDGIHKNRRGSEHAIALFEELLDDDPNDLASRWLLNIAHMTLGTWPSGVAPEQLIAPRAFESEYDIGRFQDVAPACGLDVVNLSGGEVIEDLDGDARLDVMTCSVGLRDPVRFFHNLGDGKFEERTHAAGLDGEVGGLNMIDGDYDNDGDVDVLILRGAWLGEQGRMPNSLLRNRGDGTFEDVTKAAGLLTLHPTQTAAFADLDGDGWLDLVVGNETRKGEPDHPCEVFVNRRDGTFQECAAAVGAALCDYVKAVAIGDYDNDGRPDVYFSCRASDNHLLRNEPCAEAPGFRFRDVTAKAGVARPQMSFPAFFFDYDSDGWLDLFVGSNFGFGGERVDDIPRLYLGVATMSERCRLYRNRGDGTFIDVAPKLGLDRGILTMGLNYGDLDNDGWLDVYLGTGSPDFGALIPNRMFRNDQGQRFQDVTTSGGFGNLQKGHAIGFADFDDDGDQDIYADFGGFYSGDVFASSLFENPGHGNHWLTLRLVGTKANRFGVGARIEVKVRNPNGARSIHVEVGTGGSFGVSSLQQEIGLGDATAIESVVIRWPGSGKVQEVTDLKLDTIVRVTEGAAGFEVVPPKRCRLGGER